MKRPPLSRQSAVGRGFGLASAGMLGYMLAILDGQRVMIIKQLAALAVLALTLSCCATFAHWRSQVAPHLWSPIPTGAENIATIATTRNGVITIAGAGVRSPVVVTDRHWRSG
jgi:hypothetical protein